MWRNRKQKTSTTISAAQPVEPSGPLTLAWGTLLLTPSILSMMAKPEGDQMATICPKDGKGCIDDVCRGSGVCGITGHDMWDECPRCHGIYASEFGVECACEPDDYIEDDPMEDV